MRHITASIGMALLLTCAPVTVVCAQDLNPPLTEISAETLQPGEFRWNADAVQDGDVSVVVSIARQMAYVYRAGTLIGITTVSTGKPGHETPTGSFTVLQKQVEHRSTLYNDAPMPFMQRLTWDGIALHAGVIPGHPASHGCVRLPIAFAKLLYGATRIGMSVTIQEDDAVAPPTQDIAIAETPEQPAPSQSDAGQTSAAVQLAGYSKPGNLQ